MLMVHWLFEHLLKGQEITMFYHKKQVADCDFEVILYLVTIILCGR